MLQLLEDLPETVVGVRSINAVTQDDYKQVMFPALEAVNKKFGKVSLLLVLETSVANYTVGAWLNDMKAGFKYFNHWHRIAIVTPQKAVEKFTDFAGVLIPGSCKGFALTDLALAKLWVAS